MNTVDLVSLFRYYCKYKGNEWLGLVIHEDGTVTVDDMDNLEILEDFSSLEAAIKHMENYIDEHTKFEGEVSGML